MINSDFFPISVKIAASGKMEFLVAYKQKMKLN